jgi:hypothetical protein
MSNFLKLYPNITRIGSKDAREGVLLECLSIKCQLGILPL